MLIHPWDAGEDEAEWVAFVRALGDSVHVMDDGRVRHSGAMRDLATDEQLQQQLLGLSMAAHP